MPKEVSQLDKFSTALGSTVNLHDHPELFKTILLKEEFWILQKLITRQEPMTGRELYNLWLRKEFNIAEKQGLLAPHMDFVKKVFTDKNLIQAKEKGRLTTAMADSYARILRKIGVEIASYEKLTDALDRLESWHYTRRRKESAKLEYWFLDPEFVIKYGDIFEKLAHVT